MVERIARPRMQAIEMEPVIDPKAPPFYAKLRAEADSELLKSGKGNLYLGFHLDPFHGAHWNNLTAPLQYKIALPDGAKFAKATGEAELGTRVKVELVEANVARHTVAFAVRSSGTTS